MRSLLLRQDAGNALTGGNLKINRIILILLLLFQSGDFLLARRSTDQKVWLLFTGKEMTPPSPFVHGNAPRTRRITERALKRRLKVCGAEAVLDEYDLPVSGRYIHALEEMGIRICAESRWLNAASCILSGEQTDAVKRLPFVSGIRRVRRFRRIDPQPAPLRKQDRSDGALSHELNYGISFEQNDMLNIPLCHDLGLDGSGVLIGMIDTGFKYRDEAVFRKLKVTDEYDFHFKDPVTENQEGDGADQHEHGTLTLSVLAGFQEGRLIGPAYGASLLLAKSEWLPTETHLEEDHFVEAVEWLEANGADVISVSLGYSTFDDGDDYSYEDMDGKTALSTIACSVAVGKGVVIVTSAGNEGANAWRHISAPADGEGVIAVGAVDMERIRANFSSMGPTYDGRIKPDVAAMGVGTYGYIPDGKDGGAFVFANGTSLACPLVAGICALILQAHPELSPAQVREALTQTADRSEFPDNLTGWGIPDAHRAVFHHGMAFTHIEESYLPDEKVLEVSLRILSPNGLEPDSLWLYYKESAMSGFQKVPLSPRRLNPHLFFSRIPVNLPSDSLRFYVTAADSTGKLSRGPVNAPEVCYWLYPPDSAQIGVHSRKPEEVALLQSHPNPFNDRTIITLDVAEQVRVRLLIYNSFGQKVCTLLDAVLDPGRYPIQWRGMDSEKRKLPSGIYLCALQAGSVHRVCKLTMIR
ncbi:S8 family serine peptidase [bacterium]|nr:S8 family serine peptidase [bacterium]